jgi:hypothetical protein
MVVLAAGLLSKETAVVIPLLGLLMVPWNARGATSGWVTLAGGFGVCALYVVVRMMLVPLPDSFAQAPTRYMLKELMARPIGTLTLPWATVVYDRWPVVPFLWAAGAVAAAARYAWDPVRALPVGALGRLLAAVFLPVLPVYALLFISPDLENGRYLYLPAAFWAIALIALMSSANGLSRVQSTVLGVAMLTGVVGIQMHLTSWREAAQLRDRVLAAAEATLTDAPCSPVSFTGAPDSVRGAYVFRNGLSEAIVRRSSATTATPTTGCEFVWNGTTFVRSSALPGPIQATVTR